ncbi:MAG: hypothetical protein A2Z95_05580 [Gallionellales bacterium GWA2_60_18]|nr:MAG: hypothetical protein A2Z95_05580 [Gallionellales bacterium GWA2_60_18]
MDNRIRQLLDQIAALEGELDAAVEAQEERLRYRIEDQRVIFERAIHDAHRRVRLGVFRWFLTVRPQNYLTMPIIYSAAIPLLLLDLFISLYQTTCFPVYRIAKAKRADYIVFDHQLLAYLNIIEKAHCLYCSYAVGLLAYAQEITARTEQYFCPIKHARKMRGPHSRYQRFLDYGDADDFHGKLERFRTELADELSNDSNKTLLKEQP